MKKEESNDVVNHSTSRRKSSKSQTKKPFVNYTTTDQNKALLSLGEIIAKNAFKPHLMLEGREKIWRTIFSQRVPASDMDRLISRLGELQKLWEQVKDENPRWLQTLTCWVDFLVSLVDLWVAEISKTIRERLWNEYTTSENQFRNLLKEMVFNVEETTHPSE